MKNLLNIFLGLIILTLTSCAAGGRAHVDQPVSPNLLNETEEAEEYELTIIDPGYQTWIMTHARPISFYSPSYYRNWNIRYVQAWNEKVNQQGYYGPNYPFQNRIDYEASIDYGVELDYELFWYFRYVHSQFGGLYRFPGFSAPGV